MKLIVNANVLITNKDNILLLDEIIARYGNAVENVAVNVEPIKDSPVQQNQLPTQQPVQSVPVQTQPVPVQQPVQTAVPVAEKTYTLEDLQRASSTLVQAGKIQFLQGLLQEFNSLALTTLPVEQYGAFALRLRELGAAI
ncbi:hypothetical protein PNO24_00385 [Gemella haemolysans]|uniref:hypothetical protein n=1 Tax=Gemella haemolysans TaxID=1379 RepID=UPI00232F1597|nr:hypothetical protein [Gemella haemolysans]MDB6212383.1 hypothetical protein [Gemella haemolysans]